jgi:hypothetical protein
MVDFAEAETVVGVAPSIGKGVELGPRNDVLLQAAVKRALQFILGVAAALYD